MITMIITMITELWLYLVTGKFCGGDLPLPILIGSNSIRLKFVSDSKDYGTGFSVMYKALTPDILPSKSKSSNIPVCALGRLPEKINWRRTQKNLACCSFSVFFLNCVKAPWEVFWILFLFFSKWFKRCLLFCFSLDFQILTVSP